jgi:uncharacterized protein (DUF433 family)
MNQLITIHPEVQSGTPVFVNTRVPVQNLFDYIKGGHTVAEFVDDFPSVPLAQALTVLELAASTITLTPPRYVQSAA